VGDSYPFTGGTITLNSPADDSISALAEVTFNATATITSAGVSITNMSLYTNETGIWAVRNTTIPLLNIQDDLLRYYKLDETVGDVIDSSGDLNGNISSTTATRGVTGKIGNAFNSWGEIDLGDGDMDMTGNMTISGWVYPTSTPGFGQMIVARDCGSSVTCKQYTLTRGGTGEYSMTIGHAGGGQTVATSIGAGLTNDWQYVVGVIDDVNLYIYINGVLNSSSTIGGVQSTTAINTFIGDRSTSGLANFPGTIDEVGIWNRSLTAEEITDLYNVGSGNSYPFTTQSSTQTWTRPGLSGTFVWNVEACDTDGDCGFASSNFTLNIDAIDPVVTIFEPIGVLNYSEVGDNQLLNFTAVNGGNLESCWYDYNGTNVTVDCNADSNNYSVGEHGTGAINVLEATGTDKFGVLFTSRVDGGIVNITKTSSSDATKCHLYYINETLITSGDFVGDTCDITADLVDGQSYWALTDDDGASYSAYRTLVTNPYPITNDQIYWNASTGVAGGFTTRTDVVTQVESIGTYIPINTTITLEPNNLNVTVYANDSAGNEGSNFTSWEYKVLLNTLTFPNLTTEGNIDDFTYSIKTGTGLSVATANFYYNGTSSSASVNSLGDNLYNLTISHLAPTLTSDANFTFFMQINLDDGFSVNTSSNNQTVLNVGIDNCSTNTIAILNYTLVDEDTQIPLVPADNGTIEIDLSLYSTDGSLLITTFNKTFSNTNNASVCISDDALNSSSYSLYSIARYTGIDYSEEYSHIQNLTLDNESGTEEVTLFDLLTARSTDFLITFKDANFLPVSDAIIQVERQYVGEGVFKSVEAPLTSSEGQTVAHLIRNDMIYNFVVLKNGIILGTFNNLVAFCDDIVTENCNIQLNLLAGSGQIYDYDSAVGIAYDLSYNETTRVLSVPFTTTSGDPANVSIYAVKFDQLGETEACSTALVSASATLSCTIPVALSNETISYVISVDSVPTLQGFFSLGSPLELGDAGYFLLLIIVISLALMFVESKTMTIIAVMLGFITSSMFYFIKGGILGPATAITWLIISGLILIYQLNSTGRT